MEEHLKVGKCYSKSKMKSNYLFSIRSETCNDMVLSIYCNKKRKNTKDLTQISCSVFFFYVM